MQCKYQVTWLLSQHNQENALMSPGGSGDKTSATVADLNQLQMATVADVNPIPLIINGQEYRRGKTDHHLIYS